MRSTFLPCCATVLVFLTLGVEVLAHDGDGKVRDRRARFEAARGTRGSASANLPLANESLQFPASNVQLMAWLPLRDFGLHENGNSCTGYVSPSGREYAVMGLWGGTSFVEITDPGDPAIVGYVAGPSSLWRDVKVHGSFCYAVSEGGQGIQVIDLSQIDAGQVTHVGNVTTGGALPTHTVAVDNDSGFLYRCGGSGLGLRIYNLANPAAPAYVAAWNDRYVHECQAVTYTSGPYAGRQIVFACSGFNGGYGDPALDILDVTNKSNIQLLRRFRYSSPSYSHQGWISPDRQWFYLNDELDNQVRTRVINVSSLTNPVEHPSFSSGVNSIDHNLYVHDGRIFESNYRSGLQVFDAANPAAPVRIAWFDTWPEDDGQAFNGLWNNYPFFPSKTVIGSDIEKGLFVWRIGAPELEFAFPAGPPLTTDPDGEAVDLEVVQSQPGLLATGTARLHVDAGSGWVELPLALQPDGRFLASFPPAACGTSLAWYVSARTTSGRTWSWPQGAPTLVAYATAAGSATTILIDRMDSATGWSASDPTDTATGGRWVLGDPNGTHAQPEDDHSPSGTTCWFTGQAPSLSQLGYNDVDGGTTTLTTPRYDLSALQEPVISYWRWYSNDLGPGAHNEDVFTVELTNDDGATWHTVEVVGPAGPETSGGWFAHQFRVSDIAAPTSQVRLRFIAADLLNPSNVEAAIDDLAIEDVSCPATGPGSYCVAKVNSQGCSAATATSGTPSATSPAPFLVTCSLALSQKPGLLIYGGGRATTPFQGGTLCVAPPIRRTPVQDSGGNPLPVDCSGTFAFDFNAHVRSGVDPALVPGRRVDCQYWYRDPSDATGFGSGLSDAIEFTIQP